MMGLHDDTVNYSAIGAATAGGININSCVELIKKVSFKGFCLITVLSGLFPRDSETDRTQQTLFIIINVRRHVLHYNSSAVQ